MSAIAWPISQGHNPAECAACDYDRSHSADFGGNRAAPTAIMSGKTGP